MFQEISSEEMPRHVRTTQLSLQKGAGGGVGGALVDAQRDGLCYDLSSLDNVGTSMASEEDRMQDADTRKARQVRRPTIEAAGTLVDSSSRLQAIPFAVLLSCSAFSGVRKNSPGAIQP